MKVTLDLTKLLEEGRISKEEHDRLAELSKGETKGHAIAVFLIIAVIAIVAGTVGLFPEFFRSLGNALLDIFGARGLHFISIILSAVGAIWAGSGFLAAACALLILTFLGKAGTFYTHATYFVAIQEPLVTTATFSLFALLGHFLSEMLKTKHRRVVVIFSRTCIFIVNLAFWVGSLWGDRNGRFDVSDLTFAIVWALMLVGVGGWAAVNDRRWVVNTTAVFGSIHFYTQWFERLGATPGSLLAAGMIALLILYGLRVYNQQRVAPPESPGAANI